MPAKNTIWSVIQRLAFGASVYFIWQERNFRLFGGQSRTEDAVFKITVDSVRYRIIGLKLWNEKSPLCNLINYSTLLYDSDAMKTKVADLIGEDGWKWPRSWSNRFKEVLNM
ncbi:hypothetical protein Tco_1507958 [Tanacetum coccineum]